MPPEGRDAAYLWDIVEAARTIRDFTRDVSLADYARDRKLQLAIERALEIVGEAARRLSDRFKSEHPEVPWPQLIAQTKRAGARIRRDQEGTDLVGRNATDPTVDQYPRTAAARTSNTGIAHDGLADDTKVVCHDGEPVSGTRACATLCNKLRRTRPKSTLNG
jgi:hypothetical protein